MRHRLATWVLQGLLVLAVLLILFLQVIGLPWLGGEVARDLPAEAFMRWPVTALAIVGLAFVQVGLVGTIRLLALTRTDRIFTRAPCPGWTPSLRRSWAAGSPARPRSPTRRPP
ncbi:DUF2975 domain-containing protein [Micrococcus endophyticus]|nr:DUF2975 domain-containing protein [Micrococcus endophyticus]